MPPPQIFISYSHQDVEWKDRVVSHLRVLGHEGVLDVWTDDRIGAGADWLPEIEHAMQEARVAILLVSAAFLNSEFIRRTEVPRLLERRSFNGMRVIPLIVRPVAWQRVPWLASIGARPADGRPLSTMKEHEAEEALAALAGEISDLLATSDPDQRCKPQKLEPEVAPSRLPATGRDLFGRDDQLAMLDAAWESPDTHLVMLVGWGGLGKSSLVGEWRLRLLRDGGRGAERVFDWSFSNQGDPTESSSADPFVDAALRWFGDPNPTEGTPWGRGERVARLVRSRRTLLVLDGLEPLQAVDNEGDGELRDPALQALLRALADRNPGLCVITTRLPVADLRRFEGRTVVRHDLEQLAPTDGARILRAQGVGHGSEHEMEDASREFSGHPLALTLLGSLLSDAYDHDIRRRSEIGELITAAGLGGGPAMRVMASYAAWLGDGPEIRALRLVSLFDGPAEPKAMEHILAEPAITNLTDGVPVVRSAAWRQLVARLRRTGLLSSAVPSSGVVDAHPLVRSYFREQLRTRFPDAWREANRRLLDHLAASAPELPDTLAEMAPLLAAIAHGCRAGEHERAYEILWNRAYRGNKFFLYELRAYGEELSALGHFFEERWSRPLPTLPPNIRNWVESHVGVTLVLLGRLSEAVSILQSTLKYCEQRSEWTGAQTSAGHLALCFERTGPLSQALAFQQQAKQFAQYSNDFVEVIRADVPYGRLLRMVGKLSEARSILESVQHRAPELVRELSFWGAGAGFYLSLVLVDVGALDEAITVAEESNRRMEESGRLRETAIGHSTLAHVHLACFTRCGGGDLERAGTYVQKAMEPLRRIGEPALLIRILCSRAELSYIRGNFDQSRNDLDEALALAESCRMRVYEADVHLEITRLHLRMGDRIAAAASLEQARILVRKTEYGLRERDLAELSTAIG